MSSRLRLTPSKYSGLNLVEVYHNGQWGTLCEYTPTILQAGRVICRQLGYANLIKATTARRVYLAGNIQYSTADASANQKVWLAIAACKGTESDIVNCRHYSWGVATNVCNHVYDILVSCSACKYNNNIIFVLLTFRYSFRHKVGCLTVTDNRD